MATGRSRSDDPRVPGTSRRSTGASGSPRRGGSGSKYSGTYYLSNLLQELTLAKEAGSDTASLEPGTIFEPPADKNGRMIREYFWDGLTRHVDDRGLGAMLRDDKTATADGRKYVYVPRADTAAFAYFSAYAAAHPDMNVSVVRLPEHVTADYVRSLDGRHGLLTLALRPSPAGGWEGVPFVVPGDGSTRCTGRTALHHARAASRRPGEPCAIDGGQLFTR